MTRYVRPLIPGIALQLSCLAAVLAAVADEPAKEGGWLVSHDGPNGIMVRSMEMTLYPRGEPRPALKYRLIPDDFDMVDGNAAIYYLKAMGFLEQNAAHEQLMKLQREAEKRASPEAKDYGEVVPPYMWLSLPPSELPLEKVKEFLQLTAFQSDFLREAAKRKEMSMDRHIRSVQNPLAYLLPEIQSMRELARLQSLRCRVAVAENRLDDAIAILGQEYAMSHHLGQDEFLVSNLVGIACAGIAWEDALYLVQHPQAPNLYWAFTALPHNMFDLRQSYAFERQLLYEQIKILREVDETLRPVGFWQDFLDRLSSQSEVVDIVASEFRLSHDTIYDPTTLRATLVVYVAAAYPGAKRFLIEQCGMTQAQVEAYPTAQTVFLAIVRLYDQARDDLFKWSYLPYWQVEPGPNGHGREMPWQTLTEQYGWCAVPTSTLLPAVMAARAAAARHQQLTALVQTVEAIRLYGAAHDNKLPPSLDVLPVPTPLEPYTGTPIAYEFRDDHAILTGHPLQGGLQYRLVVRFATTTNQ